MRTSNLSDRRVLQLYGLFYAGLKDSAVYWDLIVNNLRKHIFIGMSIFQNQWSTNIKVLF